MAPRRPRRDRGPTLLDDARRGDGGVGLPPGAEDDRAGPAQPREARHGARAASRRTSLATFAILGVGAVAAALGLFVMRTAETERPASTAAVVPAPDPSASPGTERASTRTPPASPVPMPPEPPRADVAAPHAAQPAPGPSAGPAAASSLPPSPTTSPSPATTGGVASLPADGPAAPASPPAAPAASPAPAPASTPAPALAPVRHGPSRAEIEALTGQARRLIETGDIAAARLLLERAAGGDDGEALFALAETYDPNVLAQWRVRGVRPNPERAQALYERALGRGVGRAQQRIVALR